MSLRFISMRCSYGNPLGGLFAAYTLFEEPPLFSKYLLSGACFIWDDRHIFRTEEEFSKRHDSLPVKLYSAVGELDEKAIIQPWEELSALLGKRNYRGLQTKWDVIPGETHISCWPASFTRGIKYLYGQPK